MVEQDYESSLTVASDIVKAGLNREDVITVLHLSLLQEFQDGTYGIAIVLKRLLILGQWAAKSPDWTSGDAPIPPCNDWGLSQQRLIR